MKELYRVGGTLNRGFVGQITYMICLDRPYSKLDIHFVQDSAKRTYQPEDINDKMIAETREVCAREYGLTGTEEDTKNLILEVMKTEIHTLATLNDEFIGCIHRQMDDRHMYFDAETATPGCIPQEKIEGVLKVTVLVFNVIKDDTGYTLAVSAE